MTAPSRKHGMTAGIAICLLGAVLFSTKAIFVKLAYRDSDVGALPLLALRMIFSMPFFLASAAAASAKTANVRFTAKQWLYIAVIGCLGYYVSSLLDFLGLQYVSAGIERLILFVYPTVVLLISSLLFGEKIRPFQWAAVAVTYVGLSLAFFGELSLNTTYDRNFIIGGLMIFVCAITYASYIVGSGRIIPVVGATKFNSYAMSFACIAVIAHYLLMSEQSLLHLDPVVYVYSVLMAVMSTVVPSYLVADGIRRIGYDNAAIVSSVGPVSTILQAAIFLGEPVFFLQIVGTALVLAGVLLIGRK